MTLNDFISRYMLDENTIIIANTCCYDKFLDWIVETEETKERNLSKFFRNNDNHNDVICTLVNITPYAPIAYLKDKYAKAEVYAFCIREPWIVVFVAVAG